jgi:predicted nucleic acid-binding protein
VDTEVARTAGLLLASADDAVGGDAGIGQNDAYIAAMADIRDDAVLTENTADFEALGVPTETY